MNKKEFQWRMEGFAWAVEMANKAKDKGEDPIAVLNAELKMRNRSGVFIFKRYKDAIRENESIKLVLIGSLRAISLIALWEEFDFGAKRMERFNECYNRYVNSIMSGNTDWTSVFEMLEEKGMTIDLSESIRLALEDKEYGK